MNKLTASILATTCALTACAVDDGYGYRTHGVTHIEQHSYSTAYDGANWYREEQPYYRNDYDHNRNGIPDYREVDRNRNGIPDWKEHNGNNKPDQPNSSNKPNRQGPRDNKFRDDDRSPNNKYERPGNLYSR